MLTSTFIRAALELPASAASNTFSTVITDSRKIQKGCLFVALKGEKFDGHEFVEAAASQGAQGVLVRRGTKTPAQKGVEIFEVEDTLEAYRQLAAEWRKKFSIPVAVVAGSVGKTTTKEILTALLRGKWPEVLKTEGSQNGFIGVAMTLLELRPRHQAAVIEVGIDEPGNMEKHIPLIGADAVVLTAIGPEHLEKLIDIPTVAREEGKAFHLIAASGGKVAVNLDDPWILKEAEKLPHGVKKTEFTLSAASGSPNRLAGALDPSGKKIVINGGPFKSAVFELPLPGEHNARNFLCAVAIASQFGLSEEEISRGLKTFRGADGRSEMRDLPGGIRVLCDYYNANPTSTEAGLKVLSTLTSAGKKWACLGDMLELGSGEEGFHRGLHVPLQDFKVDHVLLYGPRMKQLHDELRRRKFQGTFRHFESHAALAAELQKNLKSGDAVLIKGSRGMKMEEVWKLIKQSKGIESERNHPSG